MGFLARLNANKLEYQIKGNFNASEVGMILTTNDARSEFVGIFYNSADDEMDEKKPENIELDVSEIVGEFTIVGAISYISNDAIF